MPKFFYIARDNKGAKVSGAEEAVSSDELINRLQSRGLIVINVTLDYGKGVPVQRTDAFGARRRFQHYGVNSQDLVTFSRQLATMLGAAVPILKSLDTIARQIPSRRMYTVINEMIKDMEGGLSLHEAMAKHPKLFSELWVNLVETGEASGNLALVLERLASYLERNAAFKKKIVSSLIYPVLLICASTAALIFLTVKIIPTFADLFKGFNVTMPVFTRVLINVSFFIRKYGLTAIGLIVVAFFFVLRPYLKTKEGRRILEKIEFSLPVFGEFYRGLVVERFSSSMSTLVESGVPILYALEIAEHSVGNYTMADIVRKVKEEVREGKTLNHSLEESGFFEPMVVQMLAVGEEVGDLPQMLKRITVFYQEYAETFLGRFTSMFEPIMLIFMGLVIGSMVVGMFLPIFQIASIGGH